MVLGRRQHVGVAVEPPPVELLTTRRVPAMRAASSTAIVPSTFTFASAAGSVDRHPHIDLRAQMEHDVRPRGREDLRDRRRVGHVGDLQLRAALERSRRGSTRLPGRQVVDHGHAIAARHERVDQVRPDESGTACDHAVHEQRASLIEPLVAAPPPRRRGRRPPPRRGRSPPRPAHATTSQNRPPERRAPQRRSGQHAHRNVVVGVHPPGAELEQRERRPERGPQARDDTDPAHGVRAPASITSPAIIGVTARIGRM